MSRADCIRELLAEYQALRKKEELEQEQRVAEAGRIDPEIARLREENMNLAFDTMRRIMAVQDRQACVTAAEQMKQRGIFNNGEIRRRLAAAGLPEDYLDMRYRCKLCRDTGYVGDAPSRFCDCFESRLRVMQYENGSMSQTDEQCFARFDLSIFPEGPLRSQMELNRKYCEMYADKFPHAPYPNLILSGGTGLGKTFLLNCIYERVVSRNFPAVRVTAFRMFESMRCQHFGGESDVDFGQLLSVPLLLIDDLGSEPMVKNITREYLFTLINERISAGRSTVIATNLTTDDLEAVYGERVRSRLTDQYKSCVLRFAGKDLRKRD